MCQRNEMENADVQEIYAVVIECHSESLPTKSYNGRKGKLLKLMSGPFSPERIQHMNILKLSSLIM